MIGLPYNAPANRQTTDETFSRKGRAYRLEVLDVKHLHPGVDREGGDDFLYDSTICPGRHVLFQPQDAALRLKFVGVAANHLDEALEWLILQQAPRD